MEPRGCNQRQSAANQLSAKRAKDGKTIAAGCDQLRQGAHGKEGVGWCLQLHPSPRSARAARLPTAFS
jgi:hypothetical protein